jgi:dATP pyrophosphohydrolase
LRPEPFHTLEGYLGQPEDLNQWYVQKHLLREEFFQDSTPSLVERSVLSTFAFLYTLEKPLPNLSLIRSLQKVLTEQRVLTVYMKAGDNFTLPKKEDLGNYSADIQKIILDGQLRKRYDEWFINILPREYGILPFILETTKDGSRRTIKTLSDEVHMVLACDRVAQVNVVCFTRDALTGSIFILVLKRNSNKGGFWQTITGGIHSGESPLTAATRETYEETSFTTNQSNVFWTDATYSFMGDDGYLLNEYVFGCEIKDVGLFKKSNEHEEFEWLNPLEAKRRVKFENNKFAIDKLCKKIEQSN